MEPRLIVIDGPDGAGKSTIASMLKEEFPDRAVFSHEPGGTSKAKLLRAIILDDKGEKLSPHGEMLLFWAAREIHLESLIRPTLKEGKSIVTDRFDSSSFAYQVIGRQRHELETLFRFLRKEVVRDLRPRYIFLDVDPETGIKRVKQAKGNNMTYFDKMDAAFHERVREGFALFAKEFSDCTIIDASKSIDVVYKDVKRAISF